MVVNVGKYTIYTWILLGTNGLKYLLKKHVAKITNYPVFLVFMDKPFLTVFFTQLIF